MMHMLDNGSDDLFCIQSFAMELPPGAGAGRRHGGVALICKRQSGLTFREISCDDARLCGVTVCNVNTPVVTILGCYMPYWDCSVQTVDNYAELVGKLDALIATHRTSAPVALIGDFNCALPRVPVIQRPASWVQLRGFSPLSGHMQSLLDDHDLIVAEFCFPQETSYTYERGNCRTHIDHIVISRCLKASMVSCRIVPPNFENLSPHLPIIISFNIALNNNMASMSSAGSPAPRRDRLKWDSVEVNEMYKSLLSSRLSVVPESITSTTAPCLDALAEFITSTIHSAARDSGCARPSRPPKAWWTPSISAARDRCRFWHRVWVECGRPCQGQTYECYRRARRAYRRDRKAASRSSIDNEARLLHSLRRGNLPSFWRHVGRVRRQRQPAQCSLDAERFSSHFSDIHDDNSEQLNPYQTLIRRAVAERFAAGCDSSEPKVVTAKDVVLLIQRLRRGSAPGPDAVTVEHLLFGCCPELLEAIAGLLSACFATGRVPDSFLTSIVTPILKKNRHGPECIR